MGNSYELPCGYVGQVIGNDTLNVAHLEGQTVAILANGEVLPEQVVTNGTVNVSSTYSLVHIGLPYYADLETLKIQMPLKGNTMHNQRLKISNVTFFLENTRGGYLGPDENNLWEGFSQEAINAFSDANIGQYDMYTGKLRQNLEGDYDEKGRLFYRQVDPLPVTIGAIVPEVDISGVSR